ncbi:MAG: ECF-type sigma factor [Dokdonella sp.]|uniref:ECF-type sigma factor n=1 Tax=Dokdonella sp. TaxID=2291710 RepID=UPI003BB05015
MRREERAVDEAAPEHLQEPGFEEVYQRLRRVAHRERRRVDAGNTFNTTALVHEVYLDICKRESAVAVQDYFGYAARAMRNLLIDHARRYLRPKHGGDLQRTALDSEAIDGVRVDASQAIELDSALSRLARLDPRAANIVELHFFAGLGLERIAELLGVSDRTVNRDWRVARAWLQSELEG